MALQSVAQVHENGCFVACVAMLIGKTYSETFAALYPDQDLNDSFKGLVAVDLNQALTEVLQRFGFTVKRSTYRKLQSLQKHSRKNAILVIRWHWGGNSEPVTEDNPWMCHAVVFDAETKDFLDPSFGGRAGAYDLKSYQRQLDSILYVEPAEAA